MTTNWIGVDPGKDGAIALLASDGRLMDIIDMPYLLETTRGIFDPRLPETFPCFVALEAQQAMPRQGVSSTFTTGQGFGRLEGLLTGLQIPYEVVRPQRWMREMGIPVGADKRKHVEVAQSMYPQAQLTGPRGKLLDGRGDALLLAAWAMRQGGK